MRTSTHLRCLTYIAWFAILGVIHLAFTVIAYASPSAARTFTLDGRLYNSTSLSSPLLDTNVVINVKILDPTGACVLYEENQVTSTYSTDGYFNIKVGSDIASMKRTASDPGHAMAHVFQNRTLITGINSGCAGYIPLSGDGRKVRITVSPSSGGSEVLTPDIDMDSVPMAMVAESVQGLDRSRMLEMGAGSLTQTNVDNVFSNVNYPKLTALLGGTSTDYVRVSGTTGASMPSYTADPAGVAAGQVWLDTTTNQLKFHNGLSVQTISTGTVGAGGIISLGGLTGASQGFAVGAAGTSPSFSSAGTTHTLNLPNASGAGVTAGLISKSDYDLFSNKLSPALNSGEFYVGNGSNVATAVSASGDVTMSNAGVFTLATSGVTAGSYPKVQVDSKGRVIAGFPLLAIDIPGLAASHITAGTLPIARGGTGLDATPTNGQLLIGNGVDYTLSTLTAGTGISINNAAGAITINATGGGSVTNVTAGAGLNGGTITTAGTIALATTGVTAGAYAKLTVDQYGRATAGSTLASSDIPDLDASKIVSGTIAMARLPAGLALEVNVETLTGNKTLTVGVDKTVQILDTGGSSRDVTLSTAGATAGSRFVITKSVNNNNLLSIKQAAATIDSFDAGTAKEYIFDGTNWIPMEVGILGSTSYVAGANARGYQDGVAVGSGANGSSYGVAIGRNATASTSGTAVGHGASGANNGVAAGRGSYARFSGVSIGHDSDGSNNSVAVGYYAGGDNDNDATGAGDGNVFLGYEAGYSPGSNLTQTNTLVIANEDMDTRTPLIYGKFDTGRVGIGTTAPATQLHVAGSILPGTDAGACNSTKYGAIRVNSNALEVCLASNTWSALSTSGATGTVTQVTAGAGLAGGTITTAGTIALATTGIASGTYAKVTIDTFGRATAGSTLAATDIPDLDAAKITSGTLATARIPDLDASKISTGTLTSARLPSNVVLDGGNSLSSGSLLVGTTTAHPFSLSTNGATAITIGTNGNVGIGETNPDSKVDIYMDSTATSGSVAGIDLWMNVTPASTSTAAHRGIQSYVGGGGSGGGDLVSMSAAAQVSSSSASTVAGGIFDAYKSSTGTITTGIYGVMGTATNLNAGPLAVGGDFKVTKLIGSSTLTDARGLASKIDGSAGTITNAYGVKSAIDITSGSITNAYGTRIDITDSGSGTIATGYGVYIADVIATNGRGIYQAGANDTNFFAGDVSIGTITASAKLHVAGAILAGDDATCAAGKYGAIRVNSNNLQVCLATNSWATLSSSGATGTVTSIVAGTGLTGGTITTSGTIALATTGVTTGTYAKVTIDAFGRATAGSTLSASDIPDLDASKITTGTINNARLPSNVVLDGGNSNGAALVVGSNDNQQLQLETNNTTRLTVGTNGNVGIGTNTPAGILEVSLGGQSRLLIDASDTIFTGSNLEARRSSSTIYSPSSTSVALPGGMEWIVRNTNGTTDTAAMVRFSASNSSDRAYIGAVKTSVTHVPAIVIGQQTGSTAYEERMRIDTSGNVGIGTTTPNSRLEVAGAVQPGNDAASCVTAKNGAIRFNGGNLQVCLTTTWTTLSTSAGNGTVTSIVAGTGLTGGTITTTGTLALATTGVTAAAYPKVTVDVYGRVVTGSTLSTSDIPDLDASKITTGTFAVARLPSSVLLNGGNTTGAAMTIGANDNFDLAFKTNNLTRMTVGSGGNVGVGVSPASDRKLFVSDSKANVYSATSGSLRSPGEQGSAVSISNTSNTTGSGAFLDLQARSSSQSSVGYIGVVSTGSTYQGELVFGLSTGATNYSEAMRILNSGSVGIGTTTPQATLDVNGAIKIAGGAVSCASAQEGALRYNSTKKIMEFCNGSGWYEVGGGPVSCPTGFTMIGSPGARGTYCIDTNQRTAATYPNAVTTCHNLATSNGSHATMCSQSQWYKACVEGTPTGMTGDDEMVNDMVYSSAFYAVARGATTCETANAVNIATAATAAYRCCVD